MRKPPIDINELIAELQNAGEALCALNLKVAVGELNDESDRRLAGRDVNGFNGVAAKLRGSHNTEMQRLGAQLQDFVDTHKPQ